jgi:hypothetical protein
MRVNDAAVLKILFFLSELFSQKIRIRPKKTVHHPSKIHAFPLVDEWMVRLLYHFTTLTVTTIWQDYNERNTVTMDDVDFSFFLLFLPAVGIDKLQLL